MNANRFRRMGAATIATAIAAFAVANVPAASAWSGCEGDCVNSVTVTQTLGTKSNPRLKFTTTVPAQVLITFKETGGTMAGAVSSSSSEYKTSFDLSAGEILSQGKGYVAYIKAYDQNGKSYTDTVSVTALSRTVKLTLNGIKITEDSDYGAGELRAGINVGGTVSTIFNTTSISATKTLNYSKVFTAKNVPAGSKVKVEIQDDDADIGEFCTSGTSFGFTSGSNKCLDWTTGSASLTLGSTPGTGSTKTFEFYADGRLDFKVWGTYVVTVA